MQEKNDRLDVIEVTLFTSKATVKKTRGQVTDWEKIFANHIYISDEGLGM